MRYMFLIYSREAEMSEASGEDIRSVRAGHWEVINETRQKGVFCAGEPLLPTATATAVRRAGDKPLITDGPFAETKEQLAGYYILDCANLDEAIDWAAKMPTACKGGAGCVEIRPIGAIPPL